MKLPKQVEVIVYRDSGETEAPADTRYQFLALHRSPDRGGFWQPVTGGVEDYDADDEAAVVRELGEELSVVQTSIRRVTPLPYEFSFLDDKGVELTEKTFGVELDPTSKVVMSDEHDDMRWGNAVEVRELYKWDDNKLALDALLRILESSQV